MTGSLTSSQVASPAQLDPDGLPLPRFQYALVAGAAAIILSLVLQGLISGMPRNPFWPLLGPVALIIGTGTVVAVHRRRSGARLWRVIIVAVSAGFTLMVVGAYASWLVDRFFSGIDMANWAVVLLAATYAAVLAYALLPVAGSLVTAHLLRLTLVTWIAGFFASMSTVSDRTWWRDSLSFMGQDPQSSFLFNTTLVLTGLLLLVYSDRFRQRYEAAPIDCTSVLRPMWPTLTVFAVATTCIGLFPMEITPTSQTLHDTSALISLGAFLGLTILANRGGAYFPRAFIHFSRLCTAAIGLALLLWFVRLANYTFMEILVIAICTVWLVRFELETARCLAHNDDSEANAT